MDNNEHSTTKNVLPKPVLKVRNKLELRDQSIRSLTEAKSFANPTEASPQTGS